MGNAEDICRKFRLVSAVWLWAFILFLHTKQVMDCGNFWSTCHIFIVRWKKNLWHSPCSLLYETDDYSTLVFHLVLLITMLCIKNDLSSKFRYFNQTHDILHSRENHSPMYCDLSCPRCGHSVVFVVFHYFWYTW